MFLKVRMPRSWKNLPVLVVVMSVRVLMRIYTQLLVPSIDLSIVIYREPTLENSRISYI